MTSLIRAATAADFIALVPHLAGYRPARSLVLVPFEGNRTMGVMRVDLPVDADDEELARCAATFIGLVCKLPEADGLTPVVFTDDPFLDRRSGDIAYAALVHAVRDRADACGLVVKDALCLAADGWGSYLDPFCPPEGRPLTEIDESTAPHAMPSHLPPMDDSQSAGASIPGVDLARKELVGRALIAVDAATTALCATSTPDIGLSLAGLDPRAIAAALAMDDVPMLFEDALEWDAAEVDAYAAAALIWCMHRPPLRDVAITQWCADMAAGDAAIEAQLGWERGEDYPTESARHMWGDGPRPDAARLAAALEVLRGLADAAPRDRRPGLLATAAWISWALGRSTHADWYAGQALEIDPAHGLADIVRTMVAASHMPEWVFTDRSPWERSHIERRV